MKIEYIKDWTGHVKGHVIDTDPRSAKFMIDKGICVEYVESAKKTPQTETSDKTYIDSVGNEYTEEEVLLMDKRTALYKELMK